MLPKGILIMNSKRIENIKSYILFEDEHIIVCRKPAGIATQSGKISSPDMVSLLKNHLKKTGAPGEPYLSVIHRLDQPVSGILVFAKTPFAARELNRQLTTQGFGKYYRALVTGVPISTEGTLEQYLVRDARTNTSRVCEKNTPGAKLARLTYHIVPETERLFPADYRPASFDEPGTRVCELEICLDTGRHHQIRVQLASMECPIVGDTKYNPDAQPRGTFKPLCLCAYKLEFIHPKTKKTLSFVLSETV